MKRGAVNSLLLVLALVLMQACAWDITAAAPKSAAEPAAEAPLETPFFMRGFSLLEESQYPQVGYLVNRDGATYGSGVLVSPVRVLTAGHCADSVKPAWFVCGGREYRVECVSLHPLYKIGDSMFVDLAILHIERCEVQPATIIAKGYQYERGQQLVAVGYGGGMKRRSNPDVLWYYGTLIEDPTVFKILPLDGTVWFGDSGGAIYDSSGVLVGIISSLGIKDGHLYENSAVRLDLFLDWIQEELQCN